ncbi:MAG: HlyD family efflux transporter periplasmic adaptor subunit [Pseudomonadota bacterium]
MRFLRQSLTGLLLLSLTAGLLFYAGYTTFTAVHEQAVSSTKKPPRIERAFVVNVVTARLETYSPVLTAYGEIESNRTLDIRTRSGGTLVTVSEALENGVRVEAGQFLAQIDPAEAQFALDRSAADLTDAEAEVKEAERGLILARDELNAARQQSSLRNRALDRQKDLETRGVGSSAAVEMAELEAFQADQSVLTRRQAELAAESRVDQALTRLARAQIALKEAQKRLDETTIRAEFDGILDDVTVVQGRFITQNEQIAVLVDDAELDVAFRVSTAQFARLLDDDGQIESRPLRVKLETFGVELVATGQISRASASVGAGETGRKLYARLRDAQGLKPGDFVTVEVTEPALDGVASLPASALGTDNAVLSVTTENRLEVLPVNLLRRQGDTVLVSGEGLHETRVVVNRNPVLGPGVLVRAEAVSPELDGSKSLLMTLDPTLRDRLIAHVKQSADFTQQVKDQLLKMLNGSEVPVRTVERLQQRIGG